MTTSDTDPPPSSGDRAPRESAAPVGGTDTPGREGDGSSREMDPPVAQVIALHPVSPAAVRDFLASAETRLFVTAIVAARVPEADVDDLVHRALMEALESLKRKVPDREDALRGWIGTITRRVVADYLTKRKRRAKYEGPMPEAPVDPAGSDEKAESSSSAARFASESARAEPSYDPWAEDDDQPRVHAWLVRQWLDREVANHPRDKETLEILLDHARGGKTYQDIARQRGLTLTALSSRIFEFKQKYIPRYRRWQRRTLLVLLLGGAALVAAIVIWWLLSAK
jgi:DNA-directed RNA polymerase specialized sigma24 family protein